MHPDLVLARRASTLLIVIFNVVFFPTAAVAQTDTPTDSGSAAPTSTDTAASATPTTSSSLPPPPTNCDSETEECSEESASNGAGGSVSSSSGDGSVAASPTSSDTTAAAPTDTDTVVDVTCDPETEACYDVEVTVDSAPTPTPSPDILMDGVIQVKTSSYKYKKAVAPQTTVTIKGDELVDHNISSVADAMLLIPGAQTEYAIGGSARISIDSLPASHIAVLLDGVPFGRMSGGPNGSGIDFGSIALDPASVERIDVIRGLGPNGSSGVLVNIITKQGARLRASISSRYGHALPGGSYRREIMGSFDLPSADFFPIDDFSIPRIAKEFLLNAQLGYINNRGVDFNADKKIDTPKQGNLFGRAQLGWRRAGNKLTTAFSFQQGKTLTYSPANSSTDDYITNDEYNAELDGRWNHPYGYVAHFTQFKHNLRNFYKIVRQSKYHRKKTETTSNLANQNLQTTFFLGDHDISVNANLTGEWVHRGAELGTLDGFVGNSTLGIADHWYINKEWDLEGQVRGSYSVPFGFQFEALLKAGYRPNGIFNARLTLSRSRRIPTAEELFLDFDHKEVGYRIVGNPHLKAEMLNSIKGEFGVGYEWFGFTLSPFFHYITDAIVPVGVPGQTAVYTFANEYEVITAGANAIAEFQIPGNLTLRTTYTYTPIANTPGRNSQSQRISLRPEHVYRAELSGSWLSDTLAARFWVDGRGKLPVPSNLSRATVTHDYAPAMTQINIGITYSPWKWIRLGLDAKNLTNDINSDWGPNVGRHILASLMLTQSGRFW